MPKAGDIVIVRVQFTDGPESKLRPALVLFEELGNVVIAGISTNLHMNGVPLSKKEGAAQDSVIKLNYLFTVTNEAILKIAFRVNREKRELVFEELRRRLGVLKS